MLGMKSGRVNEMHQIRQILHESVDDADAVTVLGHQGKLLRVLGVNKTGKLMKQKNLGELFTELFSP